MSLQEALKLMRLELGMTQADLAKKLDKALISVNRWENGKGFPSRNNAATILEIAKDGPVSDECLNYLNETLMPETKRNKSASSYGFPDIDRDFLFQLADGSANPLYVIETDSYNLLYANRAAEKAAVDFLGDKGERVESRNLIDQTDRRCFHYFGGNNAPCPFCPLSSFKFDQFCDKVIAIPNGKKMRVHAKLTKMKGRSVYAIYLTDMTETDHERLAMYELTNDIPESIAIFNVYYDDHAELAFMNRLFFKMIGPARDELLFAGAAPDLCLVHPKDRKRLWTNIKDAIAEKRDVDTHLRMQLYDGRYHTINLNGRLLRKDTEKMTFCCTFRESSPGTAGN